MMRWEAIKRFATTFVAVFGTIAAAIGVAAFGWSCAVGYYGLRSGLAQLGSAPVVQPGNMTEQQWRAMNDTLLMSLGALSENVIDTSRKADDMSSDLNTTLIQCFSVLNQSELLFDVEQDGESYFILGKYPSKWVNRKTGRIESSHFRPEAKLTTSNPSGV